MPHLSHFSASAPPEPERHWNPSPSLEQKLSTGFLFFEATDLKKRKQKMETMWHVCLESLNFPMQAVRSAVHSLLSRPGQVEITGKSSGVTIGLWFWDPQSRSSWGLFLYEGGVTPFKNFAPLSPKPPQRLHFLWERATSWQASGIWATLDRIYGPSSQPLGTLAPFHC